MRRAFDEVIAMFAHREVIRSRDTNIVGVHAGCVTEARPMRFDVKSTVQTAKCRSREER